MTIIRDENTVSKGLAIVEKFEEALHYLYPILQACPKRHGNLRDAFMEALFEQVGLLYQAAKSGQPSRLYAADANLATLRFYLRFAADPRVKIVSRRQHRAALALLAEAGAMLGTWIKTVKGKG